jgi:cytochrome c1
MAIRLTCTACGRKIDAPDSAGGKWGKCPGCHSKIYVPLPQADDEEELKLAPIDETEEQKQKQLMLETYRLTQDILQEQNVVEAPGGVGPVPDITDQELTNHIVHYLRQMANSDLDTAAKP